MIRVPPGELKDSPDNLTELLRWLKAQGAVRMTPAMKRRLIAAGEWGMPEE